MEYLTPSEVIQQSHETRRRSKLGDHAYERFAGNEYELLDAAQEVEAYLTSQSFLQHSPMELLYEDCQERPLPENLSAYVIVPVAAGQETTTLQKTLEEYGKQDVDPATWALLLFINSTDMGHGSLDKTAIQETYDIACRFADSHPELTVRITGRTYLDNAPTIGEIRADAWDVALYDIHKNGLAHDYLIGISHDADSTWISPNYIRKMQAAAVEHPMADILTCKLLWQNDGSYSSDANKIVRYWQYMDSIQRQKLGRFGVADANAAIRIGSYAAISGFDRGVQLAETIDIRERLAMARRLPYRSTDHMHFVEAIRLKTNSRRLYRAIAHGLSPDYAWDASLPFLTGTDPVRLLNTHELANHPVPPEALKRILISTENLNLVKLDFATRDRLRRFGRKAIGLPLAA